MLAARSHRVSARQIRSWRQEGLLPKAVRIPHGYARPVESLNAEGTLDRAEALAAVKQGRKMSLHDFVLKLFTWKVPVPEDLLRSSIERALSESEASLRSVVGSASDVLEVTDAVEATLRETTPRTPLIRFLFTNAGRGMGDLTGKAQESSLAYASSALTLMFSAFLGLDINQVISAGGVLHGPDLLDEFLSASGYRPPPHLAGRLDDPAVREESRRHVLDALPMLTLGAARESIRVSSLEELERARDAALLLVDYLALTFDPYWRANARKVTPGLRITEKMSLTPAMIAQLALVILSLEKIYGAGLLDQAEAVLMPQVRTLQVWKSFLDGCEPAVRSVLTGTTDAEKAPEALRVKAQAALHDFREQHPSEFELLVRSVPQGDEE